MSKGPKSFWTADEDRRALEMNRLRITRRKIGLALGRTKSAVTARLKLLNSTPEERKEINKNKRCGKKDTYVRRSDNHDRPVDIAPSPEAVRDRDVRSMSPYRDLSGAFFGDPKVGCSALDQRA